MGREGKTALTLYACVEMWWESVEQLDILPKPTDLT